MRALCLWVLWMLPAGWLSAGKLAFEKELLEFHLAADATKVTADFRFENKTDRPVTIARVEKSCACQTAGVLGGKLTYQPGERGTVRAEFELGNLSGEVVKQTLVWEQGDPQEKPSAILSMKAHIPVLVELSQKTLTWSPDEKPVPRKCSIRMKHDQPIRVLRATCSSENFKVECRAIKEGVEYELEITPLSVAQPVMGVIRIETDCAIERHRVLLAYGVVRKPLSPAGRAVAAP